MRNCGWEWLPNPSALLFTSRNNKICFAVTVPNVSIQNCQTGPTSVEDLLAGKVDVATAAGFVLAMNGFKNENLRAVGTISSSADNVEIIARRDRGIRKPEDLKGKRVGINKGTINEFFLNTFLSFNGIFLREVQIVNLNPPEMVTALSEGKIDAASSFPPYTDAMKKNLAQQCRLVAGTGRPGLLLPPDYNGGSDQDPASGDHRSLERGA